jgi:poly(A) polymerase
MTCRPRTLHDAALAVVDRLRRHGYEALWAGGCVRDMLLGLEPADIDVATNATPTQVVDLFTRTRKVGAQFGVVLVKQGRYWIETATFRTDLDYTDGRRPDRVVFTTAEQDALRRDFTINGLFYDPIEEHVIDYVEGQRDLQAGIIRAIGDPEERLAEDHLRLLRAVRFTARFGFHLDEPTATAVRHHAAKIARVSAERIREELEKMLAHPARATAFSLMAELGLMEHLWAGSQWPSGRIAHVADTLAHLPDNADFVLSLAAVLADEPVAHVPEIGQDLRCSNDQMKNTAWLVAHKVDLDRSATMRLADFKKLLAHDRFDDLLALHRALCLSEGRPLDGNEAARSRRASIPPDRIAPPPLVTGEDLIARGLEPGPRFKTILDALYDAQLDDTLTSREQALALLLEHLG